MPTYSDVSGARFWEFSQVFRGAVSDIWFIAEILCSLFLHLLAILWRFHLDMVADMFGLFRGSLTSLEVSLWNFHAGMAADMFLLCVFGFLWNVVFTSLFLVNCWCAREARVEASRVREGSLRL